ncbi:MAG: VTC domain-containing protein, partial [Lachnospiraceae bacterium]|nr:VTC domain-containing protein [Lachnospiraceae bacterium]
RIRTYDCDDSLIRAEIKTKYRDTTHKDSVALTREQYEAMVFKAGSMQPHSLDSLTGTFARERVAISPADEVQELATERVAISPADSARDFDWECCCISPAQKAQQEFTYRILAEGYRPSCIVEYERSAYCYEPCNVRVTFDRNIRAAGDFDRFFEKDLPTVPACEAGKHILEVKYDEFLPEFLLQILQTGSLRRTSFSKFYRAELALRP